MNRHPLLWGAGAGLVLALVLAPWTGAGLGRLAQARAERDRLAALLAAPQAAPPLLAPDQGFPAPQVAGIVPRIERLAQAGGVLVETLAPASAPPPLIGLRVRLSGPEKAVLALADAIEREQPVLRFRAWRMVPAEGGGVRLSGELVGAVR